MKVLMFGWEFPPHISGGLGTACYGLTKGLAGLDDVRVLFVVPKAFGDEDQSVVQLIGANRVPVSQKEFIFREEQAKMDYIEVQSEIVPYMSEEEFWELKKQNFSSEPRFLKTTEGFYVNFSGSYGSGLMDEIRNYALIAELIAAQNDFDVIHAHDWLTFPAGIAAKRIKGKPLIVHVHATEFDRSGENVNPGIYAIERHGMEQADKIIAVSNFTRQIIIEKYGIAPEKITTVYNAVTHDSGEQKAEIKKGINEKLVTFLGRITIQKGPEYFIEAAYLVLKKMDNVRFVMAGSGDKMNEMITRVAQLGMADKFYFTGFLKGTDVDRMFQLTDVFVMPSVSEPFGIVPLEAMLADVPVIISNQSGVSEILNHAIKVDFWDTYAMADSIYGLLNYPALSEFLKESGKKEVRAMNWEQSARKVREVYYSLTA